MKLGGFQLYTSDLGGNPVRGNQELSCFLTRPKWSRGWRASGSGRWRAGSGRSDPRILGTHARLSVPQAPTLDARTVPPPRRTAGTTLSSTLADAARAASSASVCEHLLIRRYGAGRSFASAPPALGFVCELSVQCGMPRGTSRGLRQRQSMHWCEAKANSRLCVQSGAQTMASDH